ncbi:MAG: LysR family transcriptional regulator [Comamonas sp.]|jgi:DNA-binding transcriptional LysR family regulator|uniref:LysR family transcriptional regulator n=1 Tax=Comamonas sp. TaxID=34028 RepID=UPI0028508DDB|nr:LysR family transcriptional regulator [Comamonas sp.]MDR3067282.1 LysR family transcriptional regulator [Comamonas sp.]
MDQFGEMTVFLRVIEEGSFSGAGRRLELSPSAVSKLIARMEARLGVRLFERVAAAIRLTQEGERFRIASQRVVQAMEQAEACVRVADAEISGTVRIHTALTTAKYLVAPRLHLLLDRHPRLHLDFVLGTERGDFVRQGIDVAIHSGRPTEQTLIGRPLMLRPWVIAASPQYLQRFGHPEQPEDLLQHRCLNFTIRTQWNRWTFHEDGGLKTIDIPSHIGANQGELLRSLALLGHGVVRLAHFHIAADLERGTLVPLLPQFQERSEDDRFYLLYPRGRSLAPRVRAVVDFLAGEFG